MKRTEHYEEYITNDFEKVDLGGHVCVIKSATIGKNKDDREMLIVTLDMADDDTQPRLFTNQYMKDTRSPKKWPNIATGRFVEGSAFIARFCSAIEASNSGFKCWSADNANGVLKTDELIGKRVGAVFGEVEDFYNNRQVTKREIRYYCSTERALSEPIPKKKELVSANKITADPLQDIDWNNITNDLEGLPFN